jgi:hypothetical protein
MKTFPCFRRMCLRISYDQPHKLVEYVGRPSHFWSVRSVVVAVICMLPVVFTSNISVVYTHIALGDVFRSSDIPLASLVVPYLVNIATPYSSHFFRKRRYIGPYLVLS